MLAYLRHTYEFILYFDLQLESAILRLGRQDRAAVADVPERRERPSSSRVCRCFTSALTGSLVTNLPHGRAAGRLGRGFGGRVAVHPGGLGFPSTGRVPLG